MLRVYNRFMISKSIWKQQLKKIQKKKCNKCGSYMIEGTIKSIKFEPLHREKIIDFQKSDWFRDVKTFVCKNCGYIESQLDLLQN